MTVQPGVPSSLGRTTAAIAASASLSAAVDINGLTLVGIEMPVSGSWTAANLTFQVSRDGAVYSDLFDDAGNEVTVVTSLDAANTRFIRLDPALFAGFEFIKIRSGTKGAPVTQTSARTLGLALRQI